MSCIVLLWVEIKDNGWAKHWQAAFFSVDIHCISVCLFVKLELSDHSGVHLSLFSVYCKNIVLLPLQCVCACLPLKVCSFFRICFKHIKIQRTRIFLKCLPWDTEMYGEMSSIQFFDFFEFQAFWHWARSEFWVRNNLVSTMLLPLDCKFHTDLVLTLCHRNCWFPCLLCPVEL